MPHTIPRNSNRRSQLYACLICLAAASSLLSSLSLLCESRNFETVSSRSIDSFAFSWPQLCAAKQFLALFANDAEANRWPANNDTRHKSKSADRRNSAPPQLKSEKRTRNQLRNKTKFCAASKQSARACSAAAAAAACRPVRVRAAAASK